MSTAEVKKAVTIVDRATKSLETASTTLSKQVTELQKSSDDLAKTISSQVFDIEANQSRLALLDQTISDKERALNAELKLKVSENEDAVLATLLKTRGLVTIVPSELQNLKSELLEVQSNTQKTINSEIGRVTAMAEAKLKTEVERLALVHKAETAEITAELTFAKTQLESKDKQIANLEAQIEADRNARIEIAKSEASREAPTFNVQR